MAHPISTQSSGDSTSKVTLRYNAPLLAITVASSPSPYPSPPGPEDQLVSSKPTSFQEALGLVVLVV